MKTLKTWRTWLMASVAFATLLILGLWARAEEPAYPHERFGRGECGSCHEEAPRYHQEQRWELSHSHAGPELVDDCRTCHAPGTCAECHAKPPQTHTSGFLRPVAGTPEAGLHTVLGRERPSACVVCHSAPVRECSGCHQPHEVRVWTEEARDTLERWRPQLEAR
jgi:hypothetical protein